MHILEAYYNRQTALPSTTQTALAALERGAELWVTCPKCEGSGKLPRPKLNKKGRPSKFGDICPLCGGKGRALRRYDAELKVWREGLAEQTRSCRECLGVVYDGTGPRCKTCGGCGYEQALDAAPQGGHDPSVYGDDQHAEVNIDIAWRLKRMPLWVREVLELWFRPDAVAYRRRIGVTSAGHAINAPLLPLTHMGRLAYDLECRGDEDRANALIDAALHEADGLRKRAFREYNLHTLVSRVTNGQARAERKASNR